MQQTVHELDALVQREKRERAELVLANERRAARNREYEELNALLALARARLPFKGEECVRIPVVGSGTCARLLAGRECAGMLAARATRLAVVVCHPWGPLGGSIPQDGLKGGRRAIWASAGSSPHRFRKDEACVGVLGDHDVQ